MQVDFTLYEAGRQLKLPMETEIYIAADDPVRLVSAVVERMKKEKRVITTKCGLANGLGEREGDCRSGGIWLRSDCQYSENRKPSELPA